mgnify:FL=1
MAFFSTFKVVMILIPLLMGAGGWYYIKGLKESLEQMKINAAQMEDAINSKDGEITRLNENIVVLRTVTDEVQEVRNNLEKEVDKLRITLGEHDLGYLAYKKPGLVERIVNKAVDRDIRQRLDRITGKVDDEDKDS